MTNRLTDQKSPTTGYAHEGWQAGGAIPQGQHTFVIGRRIAPPVYRNSLHRARRARAVLVASAADVIGRAL